MPMKTTALLSLLALAASLPAQCLFTTVATQPIGPGCNVGSTGFCKIVGMPTTLAATLDVTNCALDVQVHLFESCGVTVPLRLLVLGFQPMTIPLPDFGLSCTLHLAPIAILAGTSGPFSLPLPPATPAFSFLMQGAALSLAPFGGQGADTLTFSDALQVDLQ
jgi:hypothetical protein